MKFLPLPFKILHISFTKFFLSFADVVEGKTNEDDGNDIEKCMGFVFLLWMQVF